MLPETAEPTTPRTATPTRQNPDAVTDANGEWFELLNATDRVLDLDGLQITDRDSDAFTVSGALSVGPAGLVVFARNADAASNGSLRVDHTYTGMDLANSADEIQLWNGTTMIDEVAWDGGPSFPSTAGAAMGLDPRRSTASGNDEGGAWCVARARYGDGDLGTPGATNDPC